MTTADIAVALGFVGSSHRNGRGLATYRVSCPTHDDRHPSLDLSAACGKTLVRCWAGCTQSEVIEALMTRGLWDAGRSAPRSSIFRWQDHITPEPPQIPECCRRGGDSGASLCEHQRRFDADMTLARLRANLTEAKAEVVSLYRTAKLSLDVETLRAELNLAVEAAGGAIVPFHLHESIVDTAVNFVVAEAMVEVVS
jgi:hypothetical protein